MRMVNPIGIVPAHWPAWIPASDKFFLAFLKRWNWKAAVLSAIARAPIFVITTYSFGWPGATLVAGVEVVYWAGAAGAFAGVIHALRDLRIAARSVQIATPCSRKVTFISTPPGNFRQSVSSGTANLAMKIFSVLSTLAAVDWKKQTATVPVSERE